MIQIANDGNLLPTPVTLTQLDEQGIAEALRHRHRLLPLQASRRQSLDGEPVRTPGRQEAFRGPARIADALAGKSDDPCVGKFLEFRIVRNPATADKSQVPAQLIPNPDLSNIPVARDSRV